MKAKVLREAGYEEALYGLAFSRKQYEKYAIKELQERMQKLACKLAHKGGGHNKFLESMMLWIDVTAPRYWWQEADTYRISTKQSESTMDTVARRLLTQEDFEDAIPISHLTELNYNIERKAWRRVKQLLPESYLQRRLWCMSYKTLQNIYAQRIGHRLPEWLIFLQEVVAGLEHPDFVMKWEECGHE